MTQNRSLQKSERQDGHKSMLCRRVVHVPWTTRLHNVLICRHNIDHVHNIEHNKETTFVVLAKHKIAPWWWFLREPKYVGVYIYTGCPKRNGQNFGRVFLMSNYTDRTQNTYIQSWTVTEIMAREVWKYDSCYTLITKFILKLVEICGFCNVNICT